MNSGWIGLLAMIVAEVPRDALTIAVAGAGRGMEAGAPVRVRLSARDPATGYPLGGLDPGLWIVPDDGAGCDDWYRRLAASPVTPEGVVPLTGYDVVQATTSGHVAIVDPVLNLASANIRSLRPVAGPVRAWAMAGDGQRLALVGGARAAVQLLDLDGGDAARTVALPADATAVAVDEDGFWLGLDDGRALRLAYDGTAGVPITVGGGAVMLVPREGGTPIALAADGRGRMLAGDGTFALGARIVAAVHAPLADGLFALTTRAALVQLPYDAPDRPVVVPLPGTFDRIAADPTGRWLALLPADGRGLAIFDTQDNHVRWTIDLPDPAVEMLFSDTFLYLTHRGRGGVTRVNVDPATGSPGLVAIAAGAEAAVPQMAGDLPHMVRLPGQGILVSSSREPRAYLVADSGGQAAMSTLPLRAGASAGIALRVRGFRPGAEKGGYEARFVPAWGGAYRALVRTDQPGLLGCARFTVAGPADPKRVASARERPPVMLTMLPAGHAMQLRFRLTGAGAQPVRGMIARMDGGWRQLLPPPERDGEVYVYRLDTAPAGRNRLFVEVVDADGARETVTAVLR